MKKEKHPVDFDGYSPEEFAYKFVNTNYYYQEKVFDALADRYSLEAEGDKNRPSKKNPEEGRMQLASGLEQVAGLFRGPVRGAMGRICRACSKYLENPYEKSNTN